MIFLVGVIPYYKRRIRSVFLTIVQFYYKLSYFAFELFLFGLLLLDLLLVLLLHLLLGVLHLTPQTLILLTVDRVPCNQKCNA